MTLGKSKKPIRSERLLAILCNGGKVTKKEIEDTMGYANMYRISCEIYCLKVNGCVIKVYKNGRTVDGYELVNVQEMTDKFLTPRGLSVTPIVGRDADISNLSDLNVAEQPVKSKVTKSSKVSAPVIEDEVIEITE